MDPATKNGFLSGQCAPFRLSGAFSLARSLARTTANYSYKLPITDLLRLKLAGSWTCVLFTSRAPAPQQWTRCEHIVHCKAST